MLFHTCDTPVQNGNLTGLFLQIWITVGWRKRECPFDYARSAKLSLFASSLLTDVWPWIGNLKQWINREKKTKRKPTPWTVFVYHGLFTLRGLCSSVNDWFTTSQSNRLHGFVWQSEKKSTAAAALWAPRITFIIPFTKMANWVI